MSDAKIEIPREQIAAFCRRRHIRKLSLFGSAVREDFRLDSDVDVLVEFEIGYTPGLDFFAMQAELSEILGHPVDLNTLQWLSPYFREEIQKEQLPVYV
jgi:uncharacterized protein